jgi:sec-independent protein translocase protein TatC
MARLSAEKRQDDKMMSVWDHLRELRGRITISLIAVAFGAIICFALFEPILGFILDPYEDITNKIFITTGPLDAFILRMKVAAYGGIVIASPVIFFQLWRFVTPGLYPNEKKYAVPFVIASVVLFVSGALVAILTFPRALDFLINIGGDDIEPLFTAPSYVSLVLVMVVAFGFAFEFPLLVVFLLLARIVETRQLRQWRRYTFLGIVVIAAVITPSQDPITLFALAVPMYILYEGAIVVGRLMRR